MIRYKAGFKYQLVAPYSVQTSVRTVQAIETDYLSLEPWGFLAIKKGYSWDGPSGPAVDTNTFMRASLVHDAFYQLMRMELLDGSMRGKVDAEMRKICLEDGMWQARAWWVWRAVSGLAAGAADPDNLKTVITAP